MFAKKIKELFESFYTEVRAYLNNYVRYDEIEEMSGEDMKSLLEEIDNKDIAGDVVDKAELDEILTTAKKQNDIT